LAFVQQLFDFQRQYVTPHTHSQLHIAFGGAIFRDICLYLAYLLSLLEHFQRCRTTQIE